VRTFCSIPAPTGTSNTLHDANGTGWHFDGDFSWGFADEGA